MVRRVVIAVVSVFLVALVGSGAAANHYSVIELPLGFQPEGIAVHAHTFYVGSLNDGDIWRGDLRTGSGTLFVDTAGRQALGMKVDQAHGLLWVAGGFTGHAYVYDLTTGAPVADFALAPAGQLVNDVALSSDAAYFTNTFAPELYRIPVADDGTLGAPETIHVTGPASTTTGGFGLNGIATTPGGDTLLVDHSDLGELFRIDPSTGASSQIPVSGDTLAPGTLDGILRHGHDLFVVQNFANTVTRVRLGPDWSTGVAAASVQDPAFEVPTAVGRFGSRLAAVNAKFDLGFPPPIGPGAPADTPFEVVVFDIP
jgi:hypothetical protein